MNPLKRFIEWVKSFFQKEYEVTIWFVVETVTSESLKTKSRADKKFRLKKLHKITQNQLIGVSVDGSPIYIKTAEKFDYQVLKVR